MPVYEYECLKCGAHFDELQKFSDAPPKKHDGCGGRVKRLLSAPAIQFKGTGWYITDYARKGSGAPSDGKDGKDGKKDAASETKTETKNGAEKTASAKSESKPADKAKKS